VSIVEVQLGVAHIDHNPANLYLSNLAALCRTCHLLHDRDKHRETREYRKDGERPLLAGLQ
jgi:5-methylcytosine-specific restriction endonuclease McrA